MLALSYGRIAMLAAALVLATAGSAAAGSPQQTSKPKASKASKASKATPASKAKPESKPKPGPKPKPKPKPVPKPKPEPCTSIATRGSCVPPKPPKPPKPKTASLLVTKTVLCDSNDGDPNDQAVCDYAVTSANFPTPDEYAITVTGNNPTPATFNGSTTGTTVTLGPGNYGVGEDLASTAAIQQEMSATSVITTTTFSGDCNQVIGPNGGTQDATGTIAAGDNQTCNITNTVTINGGEVPTMTGTLAAMFSNL